MIKNETGDVLGVKAGLNNGAVITPGFSTDIHKEQVFTIDAANAADLMNGEFHFRSVSIPKEVIIHFNLKNDALTCSHTDTSVYGEYSVTKGRALNQVVYTIAPNIK